MFRCLLSLLFLSVGWGLAARGTVVPLPMEDRETGGELLLPLDAPVDTTGVPEAGRAAGLVIEALGAPHGAHPSISGPAVVFQPPASKEGGTGEAYTLEISPEGVRVRGGEAGLYYGARTLAQLISAAPREGGRVRLTCRLISDAPRFAWRGFMLDESRYFSGETEVKRLLDAMARYKLNRFHWHLTDSPGWRIEISGYPALTTIGARGDESDPEGKGAPRFYTKEQIRSIVRYAKDRNIVVIPEIDMPGHADAAVRAYPELAGGGYKTPDDPLKWPRFTYNPGSPAVWAFRTSVFQEVAELFPEAGVIHFGGDEVHFGWGGWPALPEVRELMHRENLADNAAVEGWFTRDTAALIRRLGLKAGGWDEIASQGLPTDGTVVFWWRHDKPEVLRGALDRGYPVVLCPRRPLYFDFIQHESHKFGRTWKGFNPLADVYGFPDALGLTPEQESHVLGMQACLWTENAATSRRREFLTWPRLIAMAEAAWTPRARKDLASFEARLRAELPILESMGIHPYDPFNHSAEVTDQGQNATHLDRP